MVCTQAKRCGGNARLVALQRSDQMPLDIRSGRRALSVFAARFLHIVLAERALARAHTTARIAAAGMLLLTASSRIVGRIATRGACAARAMRDWTWLATPSRIGS